MIDIKAGRPATIASNGMVTSPHALASQAGAAVLRDGGSAIDAAVATSAALSVLYPHMTGIGGDAFWLIYDANTKAVRYIDGGGRATSRGTVEAFTKRGLGEVPYRGPLPGTLTVPGAVASWGMAHAAYGRLPLKRCLEEAIGYARDGFPVTARLAHWRELARPELAKSPEAAAIFLKDGAVLANPDLARTLEAIATDGWYGFYDGEVARAYHDLMRDGNLAGHYQWARLQAKSGKAPVYLYLFSHSSPAFSAEGSVRIGAPHGADVAYTFDNLRYADRPWTEVDQKVADAIATYWVNFAKTGKPNGAGLPEWPAYDAANERVLDIGDEPHALPLVQAKALEFLAARQREKRGEP